MYSTITEPCENVDEKKSRIADIEQELEQSIQNLIPITERKNVLSEEFRFHLEEGSNAWAMGDKTTWSFHKKRRDAVMVDLRPVRKTVNDIKDQHAGQVAELNSLNLALEKNDGLHKEYSAETLGNAIKTVTFPDDTPEWHAQRAKGIGGSDIGAIMGVSPWNTAEDIFLLKTGQVKPDEKTEKSGALWRGSMWEDHIARKFAAKHPELTLVHCKSSWENVNRPHQFANLDGLLYEPNATEPSSILEIKTSSTPHSWEDGVPEYYRLQVLWYMDAFGIPMGRLVVLIDDYDYREFTIVPRDGEMDRIHKRVDEFVASVEAYKQNGESVSASDIQRLEALRPQI